ncbi:trypsin-like serine protease [Ramicandelaber brevisporus]|nr:trypsin-like serine protease [Ramicandelaber brevisporus]
MRAVRPSVLAIAAATAATAATAPGVSSASPSVTPRIIGGTPASTGEVPFIALINSVVSSTSALQCGGSIISDRHILTAAHCAYSSMGFKASIDNVYVTLGTVDNQPSPRTAMTIASFTTHPDYVFPKGGQSTDMSIMLNDVAIITLDRPISFNSRIQPIKIAAEPNLAPGNAVTASGWGLYDNNRPRDVSDVLLTAKLTIGSTSTCKQYFTPYTGPFGSTICTIDEVASICQGDSGGPLYIKGKDGKSNVLAGITSFNAHRIGTGECGGPTGPNYFTNPLYYLDFITKASGLKQSDLLDNGSSAPLPPHGNGAASAFDNMAAMAGIGAAAAVALF